MPLSNLQFIQGIDAGQNRSGEGASLKHDPRPVRDEEVPGFEVEDIFLSRTDERGIIQSGNSVFRRLSEYEWSDIIGAPHKLIRHPDTPKSVFSLMWLTLQRGEPFGGYVKNRSASGCYYWVFAVAAPVDGGYLSVRLKPSTPLFEKMRGIYSEILKAEREDGLSPEAGASRIVEAVRSDGFRSYEAFMGYALACEMKSRCEALGVPVNQSIAQFERMGEYLLRMNDTLKLVRDIFRSIATVPVNLNILGSRLSQGRAPVQEIAINYKMQSDEILGALEAMERSMNGLLAKAYRGRVGFCASSFYEEAIQNYADHEPNKSTRGHASELNILQSALSRFRADAMEGCAEIGAQAAHFAKVMDALNQTQSGLVMTRITCRMEIAAVPDDTDNIEEILTRLAMFQQELGKYLGSLSEDCRNLNACIPENLD